MCINNTTVDETSLYQKLNIILLLTIVYGMALTRALAFPHIVFYKDQKVSKRPLYKNLNKKNYNLKKTIILKQTTIKSK